MLTRFSLYGFLKNQRYFEPFWLLFFVEDKGISFAAYGLLVGFRELCINVMEIPSGVVADLYGRRRCMIASFLAYIASFLIFALADRLWAMFVAMGLFAVGEAFRTGTHKAIIFDWLAAQGRTDQRTKVYGYTRSWSQIGSALSALLAPVIAIVSGSYSWLFILAVGPYLANIVNFLGYPRSLEGPMRAKVSVREVARHLFATLHRCVCHARLRRVLVESMTQSGVYATVKDYLQPVLKHAALAMPVFLYLSGHTRTALLVGLVNVPLYLLSAVGSRWAHAITDRLGGDQRASTAVWLADCLVFALLIPSLYYRVHTLSIALFVVLAVLQNIWRPILMSRIDSFSKAEMGATILSVDSQAKSAFTMIAAPALGVAVDHWDLWTVGTAGTVVTVVVLLATRLLVRREPNQPPADPDSGVTA